MTGYDKFQPVPSRYKNDNLVTIKKMILHE